MNIGFIRCQGTHTDSIKRRFQEEAFKTSFFNLNPFNGLKEEDLGSLHILVIPGVSSEDCHYWNPLLQHQQTLLSHVQNGLVIYGECAGAGILQKTMTYQTNNGRAINANGLGLTNSVAHGPIEDHHGDFRMRIANLDVCDPQLSFKKAASLYDGGAGLTIKESDNIDVIARFSDAPNNPVAIGKKMIGSGLTVFSSALISMSCNDIKANQKYYNQLAPYENSRHNLWQHTLQSMITHLKHTHHDKQYKTNSHYRRRDGGVRGRVASRKHERARYPS